MVANAYVMWNQFWGWLVVNSDKPWPHYFGSRSEAQAYADALNATRQPTTN
jgi:hypothetical protein